MLMVVYRGTGNIAKGTILFKVDAWQKDCMEQARNFIHDGHWIYTENQITINGDMILWVE